MKDRKPPKRHGLVECVFNGHDGALRRYLMYRLRHRQDAEDLAQEVYLRLLKVADASGIREPGAYVRGTAANVIADFKAKKSHVDFDSEAADRAAEKPAHLWQGTALHPAMSDEELQHLLADVPPLYRKILLMHRIEGKSHETIAKELNLALLTVRKYCSRALLLARKAKLD